MATSKKKDTYSEFLKQRSSNVWNHFHRSDDGQTAKCQICLKKLKTTGGSTTGLHTHLRTMHSNMAAVNDNTVEPPSSASSVAPSTSSTSQTQSTKLKKRKLMTDYFRSSDSMEAVVSRMTALNGASFRLFCESEDLRNLFKKSRYDLPKTPNTIAKMVFEHAEQAKFETVRTITVMKENGSRFTLTLDEWTSLRNRRYMNITLHCRDFGGFEFKNLGLVKITGSMTATAAVSILREHLAKFNIVLEEDIVSITTDGASVMKKMGTYIPGHHQICLAHGIQLAVIDSLYKKTTTTESQLEPSFQHRMGSTNRSDSESESDQSDDSSTEGDGFEVECSRARTADPRLYKEVIGKVRLLIKSIRKSPLKADALRAYTSKEFGENIQLQLHCRTRWSSMNDMIGSFLKLKDCVFKLLIDIKSDISFTDEEIQTLTDIHRSLEVVKITVQSICQRDATLYTADTALKFMLNKLEQQNNYLSSSLAVNLRGRIKERRLLIAGVLHYLHDSESFYSASEDDTFPKPTNDQICDVIVSMLKRLKYKENVTSTISVTETRTESTTSVLSSDEDDEPLASRATTSKPTLHQEFEKEMKKCKQIKRAVPPSNEIDLLGFVMTEKAIYDNRGERGVYLTQAYTYLTSILPTSVESERVFSSAGYFCNKIRSSLSDKMLDALLFLRTYYQEKRAFKK